MKSVPNNPKSTTNPTGDSPYATDARLRFDPTDLFIRMPHSHSGFHFLSEYSASASAPAPAPCPAPGPAQQNQPPAKRIHRETPGYCTPGQLAKRWGVHIDKVLKFIRTGELKAFDVASESSRRPRYRISEEAIRGFETARSNAAPTQSKAASPRRRKQGSEHQKGTRYF